jgi:hypothetical protein
MAFPRITTCIVCDGVRQEILSKYVILGFYGVTPDVQISIKDFALPISLCFFFCGTVAEGRFRAELRLKGPGGQIIPAGVLPAEGTFTADKRVTYVALYFQNVIPGPGVYQVSIMVDGVEHFPTSISFVHGNPARMMGW